MRANKILIGSATLSPIFLHNKQFIDRILLNNEGTKNECHDMKTHMEEEAAHLDKIFSESGSMMDPHEMMEMMMNKGKDSLKPYPFEKIMQNCTVFKQHEAIDGLNLNVMLPLGQNFQVGGQWMLSNQKGASFELTSSINSSNGSPY